MTDNTPVNLDPAPYESISLEFKASVRCSEPFEPFDWAFYPRPQYNQNIEDYR